MPRSAFRKISLDHQLRTTRWFATELVLAITTWSGPKRDQADFARRRNVDLLLTVLAAVLPWSTSVSTVVIALTIIAILPTIRPELLTSTLNRNVSILPIALFLLAVLGTSWSFEVPWIERISAAGKSAKLLMVPLLFYHFRLSQRASWVLAVFVFSNLILALYSFLVFQHPSLAITTRLDQQGIPVKNYIDQSQGFAFIAIVLIGVGIEALSRQRPFTGAALWVTACLFLANLIFVNLARTAFIYLPAMLALLLVRYVGRRGVLIGLAAFGCICVGLWSVSPNLQRKVVATFTETSAFEANTPIGDRPPSAAMRLEFWRKSLKFFAAAPIVGHGTGSTRSLFERDAVGRTGLSALVVANPHNQTLAVAIQWGLAGVLLLWGMWISHVQLFRGAQLAAWIGMLATLQNIISSIFNSHLADFYEGWIYVLAVGVSGGLVLRTKADGPADWRFRLQDASSTMTMSPLAQTPASKSNEAHSKPDRL